MARLPGKVLQFGWGTPMPRTIQQTIAAMEQIPFDGLVLDLDRNSGPVHTGTKFGWQLWGATPVVEADYTLALAALQATPFGRFTDNFLSVRVTPGTADWFDDAAWATICDNMRLAASLVKRCGPTFRGLFVDTEAYQGLLWEYPRQAHASTRSFAAYQAQVRLRGSAWMSAILAGKADCVLLFAYGYGLAHRAPIQGGTLATSKNGLLPAFLDGVLDAMPHVLAPRTLVHDGWEQAYAYTTAAAFQAAYDLIHQKGVTWYGAGCQVPFRQHYRASFGLWMDYRCDTTFAPWQTDPALFGRNYFTPEMFAASLRLALTYTDRYVWVYTTRADWWTGLVPPPYVDALTQARFTPA